MHATLIATVGASDLQVYEPHKTFFENRNIKLHKNRNLQDYYIFEHPRDVGEQILGNYEAFKDYIEYPIIRKAIGYIIKDLNQKISRIIFITTDQDDDNFRKRDTLYFGEILKKLIHKEYGTHINIEAIKVKQNIIYYDSMYEFFGGKGAERLRSIIKENNFVYLLPQGGIDAINTTLMLRCIEWFHPNITQLSVNENGIVSPLNFPNLFMNNIEKQKILHLLKQFDYTSLLNFTVSDKFRILLEYIIAELELDTKLAQDRAQHLITLDWENRNKLHDLLNKFSPIQWLYIATFIKIKQNHYSDALFRLFALFELFLNEKVSEYFEEKEFKENMPTDKWNSLLNKKGIAESLQGETYNGQRLDCSKPSRIVLQKIYEKFINDPKKEKWLLISPLIESLNNLRNDLAHRGRGITKENWDQVFSKHNMDNRSFLSELDQLFGINPDEYLNDIHSILERYLKS
ncbi:MAG: hypothetical protein K6T34_08525 [Thermoflavifilum sp.]|nr:hypothetical protein [Thermoflavifilum sp.]